MLSQSARSCCFKMTSLCQQGRPGGLELIALKVLSNFAVLLFAQSKGEPYSNADGIARSAVNAEDRVVSRGDS
jgi:hypothetical protein